MRKKINPTTFDLCLGIVLYGIVFEIILLIFSGKPAYSIGLWIGIVLAVVGSIHMWWSLDRSLDMVQKDATRQVTTNNIIRYFVAVMVLVILVYTDFANPIFAFCGYMGMKVSAYMNPFVRKISAKVFKIS